MNKGIHFQDDNLDISVKNFRQADDFNTVPDDRGSRDRFLYFSNEEIRAIANEHLESRSLVKIVLRQFWSENQLKLKKKVSFRKRQKEGVPQAYCEMSLREFEGINARQQWANWRTIPKNLSGILRRKPVFAVDLCCGVGHSTEVLACYLPEGSKILGLEYNSTFLEKASAKEYTHLNGIPCQVFFRGQSVLDAFHDETGHLLPAESVDLVNSSGAVGAHFEPPLTQELAREIRRVLKKGGIAMIDSGPPGTSRKQLIEIFKPLGFKVCQVSKSCLLDIYTQVCFEKL